MQLKRHHISEIHFYLSVKARTCMVRFKVLTNIQCKNVFY